MTDIDFDELDQAVNSAMSDQPKASTDTQKLEPSRPLPHLKPVSRANSSRTTVGRFMDIKPPVSSSSTESLKPKVEVVKPELSSGSTDMPDPIAVHEEKMSAQPDIKENEPNLATAKPEVETGSPFLPDTRVEKRPLGAFSTKSDKSLEIKLPFFSGSSNDEYSQDKDSKLPEELQRDVLKVEADSTVKEEPTLSSSSPITVPPSTSANEIKPAPTAVYDTKDYHAALKHTQKKKLGWLRVALIIIVALIGASAGAAAYFFLINPQ